MGMVRPTQKQARTTWKTARTPTRAATRKDDTNEDDDDNNDVDDDHARDKRLHTTLHAVRGVRSRRHHVLELVQVTLAHECPTSGSNGLADVAQEVTDVVVRVQEVVIIVV